ncbi:MULTISPECIES: hydrogenase expression/formation protein HypE [Calditerrivibrio]|uniref:Hydrogenase expression/formation protein HypE n=1 Tax=Calditerrivibrio nitroreducens TaxID=477976 RepID=A0A2J6WNQ7_9BACT|nr:MAG: hydrogenase expression/formation protein HypE [Calditerrivibrio nitroreducens]
MDDIITLSVGGGGRGFQNFLNSLILKELGNPILNNLGDSSYITIDGEIAFTTDSFVVEPEFFPGGDIGKLTVCGTCNDLAVSGAIPMYLSLSFIISEGYSMEDLKKIVKSIKQTSEEIGIKIVCGDTKVIPRNGNPQVFINSAGIGKVIKRLNDYKSIKVGDRVIITSDIGRHGISMMLVREGIDAVVESDCCLLYEVIKVLDYNYIHFVRDATRGGVAAVLNEIVLMGGLGFEIEESTIPIEDRVKYYCEFFGYDPLHIPNEGVAVIILDKDYADDALDLIRETKYGKKAAIVGEVVEKNRVILNTSIGGKRYVEMPLGEILPRIC